MNKIETVEELIMTIKSVEVSAHVWKWDTSNAAEISAIKTFYEKIHHLIDTFIKLTLSEVGFKDGGIQLQGFIYVPIDSFDPMEVVEQLKDFLLEKIRTPNGPFSPELDNIMVRIIESFTMFNYKMMLD